MAEKTIIKVKHTEKKYLAELFGITYPTVRKALGGSATTDLQKKIRKAAIERGGTELQPIKNSGS
jgi:hypothetical protein